MLSIWNPIDESNKWTGFLVTQWRRNVVTPWRRDVVTSWRRDVVTPWRRDVVTLWRRDVVTTGVDFHARFDAVNVDKQICRVTFEAKEFERPIHRNRFTLVEN
jgi:hypothetical protein